MVWGDLQVLQGPRIILRVMVRCFSAKLGMLVWLLVLGVRLLLLGVQLLKGGGVWLFVLGVQLLARCGGRIFAPSVWLLVLGVQLLVPGVQLYVGGRCPAPCVGCPITLYLHPPSKIPGCLRGLVFCRFLCISDLPLRLGGFWREVGEIAGDELGRLMIVLYGLTTILCGKQV